MKIVRKYFLPMVGLMLSYVPAAKSGPPAWDGNPYLGLDSGAIIAGRGLMDFKPDTEIARAVAYAHSIKGICGVMSHQHIGSARKIYGSDDAVSRTEQFVAGTTDNFANCPLGSGIFKDYMTDNESVTVSVFKTRRFEDENIRVFVEEYEDREGKVFYARAIMPVSAAAYLDFTKKHGVSEVEIMGSMLGGNKASEAGKSSAALTAEFRRLRDVFVKDTATLEKTLTSKFKIWKGGNIKVYMQEIQGKGKVDSELLVEDADARVTWVEHMAAGVLTRQGLEKNFIYNPHAGGWMPVGEK